jgi:hypothetical protein
LSFEREISPPSRSSLPSSYDLFHFKREITMQDHERLAGHLEFLWGQVIGKAWLITGDLKGMGSPFSR